MKTVSATILHYGLDYLGWAIRSVYDVVDECCILYTPTPSHGHGTDAPPVETRTELMRAAVQFDHERKVHFYEIGNVIQENEHRNALINICKQSGADLVLVIDADEIWAEDVLRAALLHVWEMNSAREWRVNMVHLWRSFDYCCRDDAWPARIIDLRHSSGVAYIPKELGEIYHFGYCVTDKVAYYKWLIHGHKDELRPDWLETKWAAWPPVGDCHPTNGRKADGSGWWDPEPFDKGRLPGFMSEHPFYNLERIA